MEWTLEEDDRLRTLRSDGLSNREIAAAIGRTYHAVKRRALVIGLNRDLPRGRRPWTPEEIVRLREMYAERRPITEIGAALGRSRWAVVGMARSSKLDLERPLSDQDERFWSKVDQRAPDECWPWLGALDRKGYGAFMRTRPAPKHRVTASRFAYELTHGVIPAGLHVLHRCDNPLCCNPAHLFVGTNADNIADRIAKVRQAREGTGRRSAAPTPKTWPTGPSRSGATRRPNAGSASSPCS